LLSESSIDQSIKARGACDSRELIRTERQLKKAKLPRNKILAQPLAAATKPAVVFAGFVGANWRGLRTSGAFSSISNRVRILLVL
jgi:hypothetical protein